MAAVYSPLLQNYLTATRCVTDEYTDVRLELIEGELPAELVGTLFRNGNGRFVHQGVQYEHLFDGDGMIARFRFDGTSVHYRNRYVRTAEFVEEERVGKMLYRNFGTNLPGGFRTNFMKMRFKNTANTSLIQHGGSMLALWEGGLPHRIDPETLETLDRFDYNGLLLNSFSWIDKLIMPELPFSAHPKVHPDTGVMHNFGTIVGLQHRLALYEVSPTGEARMAHAIPMPQVTFAHDFILTQTGYQIFFLTPVSFDVLRAFSGVATPAGSMRVDRNKPTQIVVVAPNGDVHRLETEFGFVFHFINGYQETDGTLMVDALMMPDFPDALGIKDYLSGRLPDDYKQGRFTRFRIDLATKAVSRQQMADYEGELPEINPDRVGQPYRYAWCIGRPLSSPVSLLDHIVKIDIQTGEVRHAQVPETLVSEPIVVPRGTDNPVDDDAYLLYLRYDSLSQTTDLVVADAADLHLIARLRMPHNIPLGFHGMWLPA